MRKVLHIILPSGVGHSITHRPGLVYCLLFLPSWSSPDIIEDSKKYLYDHFYINS